MIQDKIESAIEDTFEAGQAIIRARLRGAIYAYDQSENKELILPILLTFLRKLAEEGEDRESH